MEEQHDFGFCPKCGMKYSKNNFNGFCIHCGCNINAVLAGQAQINPMPQQQGVVQPTQPMPNTVVQQPVQQSAPTPPAGEQTPGGAIAYLVISIIGVVMGLPLILQFGVIWLIFGAFSGDATQYYLILYVCLGLALALILSLPASIINMILKGRHTKKCLLIVLGLTFLGLLVPLFMQTTGYNPMNSGLKNADIEENRIIYQDENYIVKQKEVKYKKNKIFLTLDINHDLRESNNFIHGRVNNCYVSGMNLKKEEDGYYHTEIPNYQLKYYDIEEPKQIDLILPLNGEKSVTIKTNSATENNQQQLPFEEKGTLYQNKYFKIYYNPNYTSTTDLYIESLVSNNYRVQFKDVDFDTPGYINTINTFDTKDYTIQHINLSTHPCDYNLSYIKGEYKVYDETNQNVIDSGTINEVYKVAKIDKRRCNANE